MLQAVEGYNKDDCVSTAYLRDWLETLREQQILAGIVLERPSAPEVPAATKVTNERVEAVKAALLAGVPADRAERSDDEHGRWLLAHLLEWHRREEKVAWWERFRLSELGEEDLFEEDLALAGLSLVGEVPPYWREFWDDVSAELAVASDVSACSLST